jgi:hypothetical protein
MPIIVIGGFRTHARLVLNFHPGFKGELSEIESKPSEKHFSNLDPYCTVQAQIYDRWNAYGFLYISF